MQPVPDPPGPTNPGALAFLALFGCGLLPLWWLVQGLDFTWVQCASTVQLAPEMLDGALCGLFSVLLIVAPLWAIAGAPRRRAVTEDDSGIEWDRPRTAPSLVPAVAFGLPVTLGAVVAATIPRAYGIQCDIQDFDMGALSREAHYWSGSVAGSCSDPTVSAALREACTASQRSFGIELAVLLLFLGGVAFLAWRTRRAVGRVVIDERGVGIDGERLAFADLDAVEQTDDVLRFVRFDGSVRQVPLWPSERALARRIAEKVRPLLPRDPEDRPEARQKLAALT